MRLWSLHPKYLDAKGIVALWREALLARQVLRGLTRGYQFHPQLDRFKNTDAPLEYLEYYLYQVFLEAKKRGYQFDATKILPVSSIGTTLPITNGQLEYELEHLRLKVEKRAPEHTSNLLNIKTPAPHPIFHIISGKIASWERV